MRNPALTLAAAAVLLGVILLCAQPGRAQQTRNFTLIGGNVQKRANAALALMAYSVVPDLAGSALRP